MPTRRRWKGTCPRRQLRQVAAVHQQLPAGGSLDEADEPQQGALAGPGVAGDEDHLAAVHLEADVGKPVVSAFVTLADVVEVDHPAGLGFEQGGDELVGVEGAQVVDALADADVADRQLQPFGDGEQDAALGGAVELGDDDAGEAHRLVELHGLVEGVLPRGAVHHQPHLVGCRGVDLLHDPGDLRQLVHQVRLGVQPAGGVGEQHVHAP